MKKLLLLLAVILVPIGVYFVFIKAPAEAPGLDRSELSLQNLTEGQGVDYEVRMTIRLEQKDRPESEAVELVGVLSQSLLQGEYTSAWRSIERLKLEGQIADPATYGNLLGQPIVTRLEGTELVHQQPAGFPANFLQMQTSLLGHLIPRIALTGAGESEQNEEEGGQTYLVRYTTTKDGEGYRSVRRFLDVSTKLLTIDPKKSSFTALYDAKGRLLAQRGALRVTYAEPAGQAFTLDLDVKAIGQSPAQTASVDRTQLQRVDSQTLRKAQDQLRSDAGLSYPETMKQVQAITDKTDGAAYYDTFLNLTAQIRAHPELSKDLAKSILENKERDASGKRRLSAMFGALAESHHAEGANTLADLSKSCPDNDCKLQAVMGLNTHSAPSGANMESMMELARQSPEADVAATAVIAAGAMAPKVQGGGGAVSGEIIALYQDPAREAMKTSVIAAMGNHGDAAYWPTLQAALKDPAPELRAAAAYSLRNIPSPEVTPRLIEVLQTDTNSSVLRESLKAVGARQLTETDYNTIAKAAASFKDRDLQEQAAHQLVDIYSRRPELVREAMQTLEKESPSKGVKALLKSKLSGQP